MNNPDKLRRTGYAYHRAKQKELIKASIRLQIAVLTVLLIIVKTANLQDVLSVFIGGACALIPNIYYALYSFRYIGANQARKVLNSIYLAEAIKFILIICLLSISFSIKSLIPSGILLGFIVVFGSLIILPVVECFKVKNKDLNKEKNK